MSTSVHTDIAVIGLGAMGSAALYQLAKRGVAAIGIDRFSPPHAQGSSHGETRITRQGVGEGRDYIPLVINSHRIWRELEAETGETLLVDCGVLIIGPGTGANSHHGRSDFLGNTIAGAREFAIAHEVLDSAEIARRFPQFIGLKGDEKAYYEPGGGYVMPERCIAAHLSRARDRGATTWTDTEVTRLASDGEGVTIETSKGRLRARHVIVSAGAWTAPLLGKPFDRLLTVSRQVLHWFTLADTSAYKRDAPVFLWMHGSTDVDYFYSFPPFPGDPRLKVATEQYGSSTSADRLERTVGPAESAAMFSAHVDGRLAGATSEVAQAAACLYTTTPDRGFIIDRHPQHDRVTVVSACSGHGFKHSAGIGEAVVQDLVEGKSSVDLAPFTLARFAAART